MGRIQLSMEAATKIKHAAEAVSVAMQRNAQILDSQISADFAHLQDPTYQRYLQRSAEMQVYIRNIVERMNDAAQYCDKIIAWIRAYNER